MVYHGAMSGITEIEQAVKKLPPQELAKFRKWFARFDATRWDRQFEQDVAAGRLDALGQEAAEALRKGQCTDL